MIDLYKPPFLTKFNRLNALKNAILRPNHIISPQEPETGQISGDEDAEPSHWKGQGTDKGRRGTILKNSSVVHGIEYAVQLGPGDGEQGGK